MYAGVVTIILLLLFLTSSCTGQLRIRGRVPLSALRDSPTFKSNGGADGADNPNATDISAANTDAASLDGQQPSTIQEGLDAQPNNNNNATIIPTPGAENPIPHRFAEVKTSQNFSSAQNAASQIDQAVILVEPPLFKKGDDGNGTSEAVAGNLTTTGEAQGNQTALTDQNVGGLIDPTTLGQEPLQVQPTAGAEAETATDASGSHSPPAPSSIAGNETDFQKQSGNLTSASEAANNQTLQAIPELALNETSEQLRNLTDASGQPIVNPNVNISGNNANVTGEATAKNGTIETIPLNKKPFQRGEFEALLEGSSNTTKPGEVVIRGPSKPGEGVGAEKGVFSEGPTESPIFVLPPNSVYINSSGTAKACRINSDCYNLREPNDWCPLPPGIYFGLRGCFCDHVKGRCFIERHNNGLFEYTDCSTAVDSKCVIGKQRQHAES